MRAKIRPKLRRKRDIRSQVTGCMGGRSHHPSSEMAPISAGLHDRRVKRASAGATCILCLDSSSYKSIIRCCSYNISTVTYYRSRVAGFPLLEKNLTRAAIVIATASLHSYARTGCSNVVLSSFSVHSPGHNPIGICCCLLLSSK